MSPVQKCMKPFLLVGVKKVPATHECFEDGEHPSYEAVSNWGEDMHSGIGQHSRYGFGSLFCWFSDFFGGRLTPFLNRTFMKKLANMWELNGDRNTQRLLYLPPRMLRLFTAALIKISLCVFLGAGHNPDQHQTPSPSQSYRSRERAQALQQQGWRPWDSPSTSCSQSPRATGLSPALPLKAPFQDDICSFR